MALTDPAESGEKGTIPEDVGYVSPAPTPLWIVIGRLAVVAAVRFGLHEWSGATLAATIVGAAWLLGRIS